MSRLPVRLRLTLAFTLAMAVVLSGVGALLYVRLGDSLQEQLDDSLAARAETLSALAQAPVSELPSGDEEGFAQLLDPEGSLLAASPSVAAAPVISTSEIARASSGSFLLRRQGIPGLADETARLLVTPIQAQGQELTLVVGASLEDRAEALGGLLAQLLVVGPLALLASALAGYFLAGAALRPVEAMRRRAAEISTEQLGHRLPLPRANDEIRRLGSTLNAMLDRLEAGVARERRFVADASHELRTPLALLQTELELALRRPRSREELESALASAAEEVERLTRLAEDLLVLARMDEGALVLHRTDMRARDLLDGVARRFAARATGAGRVLEVSTSGPERVVGDRVRLEQALGNLVDNALRYGAGTVRLEAEDLEGETELRVSDEGAGFPIAFLPRAFDRFSRADEAREGSSSGLGLAIAETVARAHGGSAYAANNASGGAVVALRLPGDTVADLTRGVRQEGGGSPAVTV